LLGFVETRIKVARKEGDNNGSNNNNSWRF